MKLAWISSVVPYMARPKKQCRWEHCLMTVFALLPLLTASSARAQNYAPTMSECVTRYYDAQNYGWLAVRNTCTQAISVTFVSRSPGGQIWGSMTLGPNQSESTGHDRDGVNEAGGLEFYACPNGYIPVDTNGNFINTRYVTEFRCKKE